MRPLECAAFLGNLAMLSLAVWMQLPSMLHCLPVPFDAHHQLLMPSQGMWAAAYFNNMLALTLCRAQQLQELGFELDDESAEWMRWFNEVKVHNQLQGHSCPGPLTTGNSFMLTNW